MNLTSAQLTCEQLTTSARLEANADLRAIQISKRLFEQGLSQLHKDGPGLPLGTSPEYASKYNQLMPHARAIGFLTASYLSEYMLIVHQDPEAGLATVRTITENISFENWVKQFSQFGQDAAQFTPRGHYDIALRTLYLLDALKGEDAIAAPHAIKSISWVRLASIINGRVGYYQKNRCTNTIDQGAFLNITRMALDPTSVSPLGPNGLRY